MGHIHFVDMPTEEVSFDDGPLHIDLDRREVTLDDVVVELTPQEYDVLAALVRHRGKPLSSDRIGELYGRGPASAKLVCLILLGKLGVRDHEYPWEGVIRHGDGGYWYDIGQLAALVDPAP